MYFVIYQDSLSQWRWTLYSGNNKKIADSGEAYWNEADCAHGIGLVMSTGTGTPVYRR